MYQGYLQALAESISAIKKKISSCIEFRGRGVLLLKQFPENGLSGEWLPGKARGMKLVIEPKFKRGKIRVKIPFVHVKTEGIEEGKG